MSSVDDGPVAAFDRDTGHAHAGQSSAQRPEVSGRVVDVELLDCSSRTIDHAHRVRVGGPVDAGEAFGAIIHVCSLALSPVGVHPVVQRRVSRSLTDRRSLARSPIASRHVLGRRTSLFSGRPSDGKRPRRWPDGHQWCASSLTAANTPMVDQ